MTGTPQIPPEVTAAFGVDDLTAALQSGGLINQTFVLRDRAGHGKLVIQRLHPIFAPEVNLDIEAVTAHLADRGLATPRLIRTRSGEPWVRHLDATWRALSYLEGRTMHTMPDEAHAASAGGLVGRFHLALADLDHGFRFARAGVHDTAAHLKRLAEAAGGAAAADGAEPTASPTASPTPAPTAEPSTDDEALLVAAAALAREIRLASETLPPLGDLPLRIVHGDLKVSNILFDDGPPGGAPRACALVDLDTLGRQTIAYELGDALRSWCNPRGEDTQQPVFDLALFAAALAGYAQAAPDLLSAEERASIVPGLETVALELAARFCADVFDDRYFGWDSARYRSRRHHNLARARGQFALASDVRRQRPELIAALKRVFRQGANS